MHEGVPGLEPLQQEDALGYGGNEVPLVRERVAGWGGGGDSGGRYMYVHVECLLRYFLTLQVYWSALHCTH